MGDAVNGVNPEDRTPDPRRMVAAAAQARALEVGLTARVGHHVPAAHEALLIPYEQGSMCVDTTTGKKYLLSADLPWIGVRTNAPDCAQVEMLTGIENPVGIKIGPNSDAEHIRQLAEKLNPDNEAGKLVFMIRVGADREAMDRILGAIKLYAPNSIHMYDIHGSTVSGANGVKIRAADTIAEHVNLLSEACEGHGLKLHGVHLETTGDSSVTECVDEAGQMPGNKSLVDPQLNPRQTTNVLNAVAPCLTKGTLP